MIRSPSKPGQRLSERVVIVDCEDRAIGTEEKLQAHRRPLLHRAFSVFLYDPRGRLLLQRRALDKYHSGGSWTNTCCGHPLPGEDIAAAARRRLGEELGILCPLYQVGSFIYSATLGPDLYEHELDHVLAGEWQGTPDPDPAEVMDWRWARPERIRRELRHNPTAFTAWFMPAFALSQRARREREASTPVGRPR
jgi:isopentenyl-diphosphate delta-isomerase